MDLDLDSCIERLKKTEILTEEECIEICMKLQEHFYDEPNLLNLTSPITICGDIHGQLFDLFQLFNTAGSAETVKYLFMGDYVDRGYYSLQTFLYLAILKLKYPSNVYLLRGNHECRQVNHTYGFYSEIIYYFGHSAIWSLINDIFDLLPMAALIDKEIFSTHGGLSPDISKIDKINILKRTREIPCDGPFCDLVWSDPEEVADWRFNTRGAGFLFGERQSKEFLRLNELRFVTRSHQLAHAGYQWFFDFSVVTVWSAPNYMYRSGNLAAVMQVDKKLENGYNLVVFDRCPDNLRMVPDEPIQNNYFV